MPTVFLFVGGHSVSFIARDILELAEGAIDCILKGEGDTSVGQLLDTRQEGGDITTVLSVVTLTGEGPPPIFVPSLDAIRPARDLLRYRRKYFIGTLDPAASIEVDEEGLKHFRKRVSLDRNFEALESPARWA